MVEAVRLVIWDLDETFWRGTLSEGGITEYVQHHHDLIVELARRGIISSICSKNEPSAVLPILKQRGIDEYLVFCSISWEPKGPRLKALIEAVQLRPETVMFIDDNPSNLAEAVAMVPGIQVESEQFIGKLLHDIRFVGKQDRELSRLNQYKLLEGKQVEKTTFAGSNEEFLRSCDVRVFIEYDIKAHLDRAIELINRTNQLNFTKARLPEEPIAAQNELLRIIDSYDMQAGLIHVCDNYGDYGFVGLFVMNTQRNSRRENGEFSELRHFCFSCRTLGMLVEQWVYEFLGRPKLKVVGEVLTDLSIAREIDWIRQVQSRGTSSVSVREVAPRIVVWGGCEANAVGIYMRSYTRNLEIYGNYAFKGCFARVKAAEFILSAAETQLADIRDDARAMDLPAAVLTTNIFNDARGETLFVLNVTDDALNEPFCRKIGGRLALQLEPRMAPSAKMINNLPNIKNHTLMFKADYSEGDIEHILGVCDYLDKEFREVPPRSQAERIQSVLSIIERLPAGSKLVLVIDHDEIRQDSGELEKIDAISRWQSLLCTLCSRFDNVAFVAFSEVIQDPREIQKHGNHYDREVYLRMANCVLQAAGSLRPTPFGWAQKFQGISVQDLLGPSSLPFGTGVSSGTFSAEDVIRALYLGVLGRQPDGRGLESYASKLKADPEDLDAIATTFFKSEEHARLRLDAKPTYSSVSAQTDGVRTSPATA